MYTEFDISNEEIEKLSKAIDGSDYIFTLAALIQSNIEDESGAIRRYLQLLPYLNEKDKDIIKEIISDELNHAEKLKDMVFRYVRIKPMTD